jgi:hypothetical protein
MRRFAIVFTLVISSFVTYGQTMAVNSMDFSNKLSPLILRQQSAFQGMAKPSGLRQRNVGRMLAIGGAVVGFSGVMLYSSARKGRVIAGGQITQEPEVQKMAFGILMIEAGAGMFIPGVILWKKGQKKYNRYLEQQSVSFNTNGTGVSLRYSF